MNFRLEPEVRPVVASALALSGAVGVFALHLEYLLLEQEPMCGKHVH